MHVIVGSGISGLTAAKKIVEHGKRAVILEKSSEIGGRLRTHGDMFKFDAGAQFVTDMHKDTLKLIESLDMKKYLKPIPEPTAFIYKDEKFVEVSPEYMNNEEVEFLNKVVNIAKENRLSFTSCDFVDMSMSEWVISEWGEDLLEDFVQPWISALILSAPEDISASYGVLLIFSELTGVYTLGHGMGQLSTALYRNFIRSGGMVKKKTEVIRIEHDDIVSVITDDEENPLIRAESVILATQAHASAKIIESQYKKIAKILYNIEYSSACQIVLGLEYKIWNKSWSILIPRHEINDIAAICEPSIKCESFSPPGKGMLEIFVYGDTAKKLYNSGKDYSVNYAIDIINDVFKNRIEDDIIWSDVIYWENALPLYNKKILQLKEAISQLPDRLYLAGDYMFAPSLEAAVKSGLIAGVSACETQHISDTQRQGD